MINMFHDLLNSIFIEQSAYYDALPAVEEDQWGLGQNLFLVHSNLADDGIYMKIHTCNPQSSCNIGILVHQVFQEKHVLSDRLVKYQR